MMMVGSYEGCPTLGILYDVDLNEQYKKLTGKRFAAPSVYDGEVVMDVYMPSYAGPLLIRQGDKFVVKEKASMTKPLNTAHDKTIGPYSAGMILLPYVTGAAYLCMILSGEGTLHDQPAYFWCGYVFSLIPFHV